MTSLTVNKGTKPMNLLASLTSPVIIIFLSSNFVNVGNLAFNMIFSRWMGPELFGDLAVVLTIKLALLGILGALSSAVSHRVAALGDTDQTYSTRALAVINQMIFAGLWLAVPLIAVVLYSGSVATHLELGSPYLLFILLGSLPFCAPLNILRGVALGRLDSTKIIFSANVEMAVRLGFGVFAWQSGFGIEGVVLGISLSIIAGWAVLIDLLPEPDMSLIDAKPVAASIGLAALPFALLQLAQIAALEGDIFLATYHLSDTETGYVAALSLFQRIQFFACFALSSALLPSVAIALREGRSYTSSVTMIARILVAVSSVVLALSLLAPDTLLTLLVGAEYVAASPLVIWVAASAVLFTVNYLIATFLLAQKRCTGVAIVAVGAAIQIGLMTFVLSLPTGDIAAMLQMKLICQIGVLITLFIQLRLQSTPTPEL